MSHSTPQKVRSNSSYRVSSQPVVTRSALLRSALSGAFLLAGGWALAQTGTNIISGSGSSTTRAPHRQLQSGSVQVDVKGLDGKPVNGAEVRIETAKAGALSVKTDQKGRYVFKNLAAGLYKVTVLVNNVPTSLGNVRARSQGPVRLEFNLKAIAAGKKPKQWAWVRETGSHFGGSWVDVDESGRVAAGLDGRGRDASLKTEPSQREPPIGR
jgi:Carboxypeptidase regulatory-like domain